MSARRPTNSRGSPNRWTTITPARAKPPASGLALALNGSDWLASFAHADQTLAPSLSVALRESLTMFLHYRPPHYNTNLRTMLIEFYGSLLAFFAAFVLVYVASTRLVAAKS